MSVDEKYEDSLRSKITELEERNKQLKEELKAINESHRQTTIGFFNLKQKLEKIKQQAQTYGFHDSKGNRLSITDEILDLKEKE